MSNMSFSDLHLIDPIERALERAKYKNPTPIQAQAIPHLLEGSDVLASAQTGSGKTAAFVIPLLQKLAKEKAPRQKRRPKALILTPTRELAVQIADSLRNYGRFLDITHTVVYGGVKHVPQIRALAKGVDVLVATPGRLIDLMQSGHVKLDRVQTFTLDEADRMLDMGFIPDVRRIVGELPEKRQTVFFSATMPKNVAKLADSILSNPERIAVDAEVKTVELIDDKVMFVERDDKQKLLMELLRKSEMERVVVFTRTKHRANRLSQNLNKKKIFAEAIHGNKSQGARQKALRGFSSGKVKVLVATDVIARGIDVANVSHVINYELPEEPESYVHRIGRTARAGNEGAAFSLCDKEEAGLLKGIEKLLERQIVVCKEHSHHSENVADRYLSLDTTKSRPFRKRKPRGGRPSKNFRGRPPRGRGRSARPSRGA